MTAILPPLPGQESHSFNKTGILKIHSVETRGMGSILICYHRTGSADSEQGSFLRDRVREMYLQLVAVASGDRMEFPFNHGKCKDYG